MKTFTSSIILLLSVDASTAQEFGRRSSKKFLHGHHAGSKAMKPLMSMDFGLTGEMAEGSKVAKPSALSMDFGMSGGAQEFGRGSKAAKLSFVSMDFGLSGEASSEQEYVQIASLD
jgi:hypothetical protein